MKASDRRRHTPYADRNWKINPSSKDSQNVRDQDDINTALLQDLRAILYDLLDEQKKANRILAETFGWSDK